MISLLKYEILSSTLNNICSNSNVNYNYPVKQSEPHIKQLFFPNTISHNLSIITSII